MPPSARRIRPLHVLLAAFPAAILSKLAGAPDPVQFAAACIGVIPLAGLMGKATEELAKYVGRSLGGLLNATFGNATELIIAGFALAAGYHEMVKASLTGSIIGNLLLVLGAAILCGGWTRETQRFNRNAAGLNASMMIIAIGALMVPAIFGRAHGGMPRAALLDLSLLVALILMATYAFALFFSLRTHRALFSSGEERESPQWSRGGAIALLALATVGVAILSEILVSTVEGASRSLGLSQFFIGLIVVPIIGNAAEHSAAVYLAMKDKMDISINIALGSSAQVALFVAPALVLLGAVIGQPMDLVFEGSEIVAVILAVAIANHIISDGETHWFEGAGLLAMYALLAVGFHYVP